MADSYGFVGDLLIGMGLVDASGFVRATEARAKHPATWARTLATLGLAEEARVSRVLATALHLDHVDGDPSIDPNVAAMLPPELCRKRGVLPIRLDEGVLQVLVSDPLDYSILQDIEFRTGRKVVALVATETHIERLLDGVAPEAPLSVLDRLARVGHEAELEASALGEWELADVATLKKDSTLPPIIRLVNLVLSEAAAAGASDVHIEPQETTLLVRMRVDGLLREMLIIPKDLKDQTISRLKILSGMDIAEKRKPQDGRGRLRFDGRRIDLRVSTLPTQFGEKVVIRLLSGEVAVLPLAQLGFSDDHLRQMEGFLSRPQGMVLVTGPTGSGKTSTLYAALNAIKSLTNNIVTLEDPIEVQVAGINQMQVNPRAGVTFASGLRSILRQDPNVILVGEIRDTETAEIAMEAAQTGHLVFSTLHTNDAPATLTRLFDLGVQPFLASASLVGIVAQRLVRRICPHCATACEPDPEWVERAGGWPRLPVDAHWAVGSGCDACEGSGYKGRIAVHEIFRITEEVRDLINQRAPDHTLRHAARRAGMRTMLEDGVLKAAQGLTTLQEICRVIAQSDGGERVSESTVSAPARTIDVLHDGESVDSAAGAQPTTSGDADRRRRVLVVEDSATVAAVVKYYLELEGFDVVLATDGESGLDAAFQHKPDVVVTDWNMPGMNGLEMVRALRRDPRSADTRVMILTAESSVESETEGLSAGADDYLLKPVEPRRLAARVKALLGRSHSRVA
jgi:type IV pilus assembly protein PilB